MRKPRTTTRVSLTNSEFITNAFFRCKDDEVPWVTGFSGDPKLVDKRLWFGRSALPLPPFITRRSNNYITISTFGRDEKGYWRRGKNYFSGMYTVMVDDIGTKIPFEKLKIEPTCLVETSPGNFQAWYFLAEPERDRGRAERLIKGMIAGGLTADGSDPGMNGVTRYGRLPEGVNGKTKYADESGNPFVQRVAHWSPMTRYSLDEIATAYAIDLDVVATPTRRRGKRAPVAASLPELVGGLIAVIEAANLYLEPLASIPGAHHIICPWVHEHTDEDSTGTVYFEPSDENAWAGGFKCHHGHCQHRTIADLTHFITRLLQTTKEQ